MVRFFGSQSEKGYWGHAPDFYLSCLAYAVGLGNIWRFPYVVYRSGGGAFLVPYFFFAVILGIPALFFAMSLGQFTSQGIFTCWKCVPIFKGLGFAMALFNFYVSIFYNVLVAYCIYYLFASFSSELPWTSCKNEWNTPDCKGYSFLSLPRWSEYQCQNAGYTMDYSSGTCRNGSQIIAVNEDSMYRFNTPAQEYFQRGVIDSMNASFDDLGPIRWKIMLCYAAVLCLCGVSLILGVKVFGKVVWVTATLPLLILVVFFFRGFTLPFSSYGREYFIHEDVKKLNDVNTWADAGMQVFYSLAVAMGGWITLGSYRRFNTNPMYASMVIPIVNGLVSVIAGYIIFSFIGFAAGEQNVGINDFATSGPKLVFIVMPEAISRLPAAPAWSVMFFLMMFLLGFNGQMFMLETNITAILDQLPVLRSKRPIVVPVYCFVLFLLGLPMTTAGGVLMMSWIDNYAVSFNILIVCALQFVAVTFIYGIGRFLSDIESMVGQRVFLIIPWGLIKILWALMWMAVIPIVCLFMFGVMITTYYRMDYWPVWTEVLGWMMRLSSIVAIFAVGGIMVLLQVIKRKNLLDLFRPADDWGPALQEDRQKARLLNPSIKTENPPYVGLQNVEGKVPVDVYPPSYDTQADKKSAAL